MSYTRSVMSNLISMLNDTTCEILEDGGNWVMVKFPTVYAAAEFCKQWETAFDMTYSSNHGGYMTSELVVTFTYK